MRISGRLTLNGCMVGCISREMNETEICFKDYFCMFQINYNDNNFFLCFLDKMSMSGFNQEKVRVVYYRALYPFEARSHDEISIQPGDIVMVSNQHDT